MGNDNPRPFFPMNSDGANFPLNFNRRAGTYSANASVQRDGAERLAEWLRDDISADARIIELGAGTGFFTKKLIEKNLRVVATDLAPEMVFHGKRECPEAAWEIRNGWELPANSFDWIFSSSLLQLMPRPEEMLRVFWNALRSGGKMLHGFFVAPTLNELYSLAEPDFFPLRWKTEAAWLANFEHAGFRILRAKATTSRVVYPSVVAFLHQLHDSGATANGGRKMPTGLLRKLLREYEKKFHAQELGVPAVYATWNFLQIECEKK